MRKNILVKTIALSLMTVLALSSCTPKEEVPELKEPVGAAPTFRPVMRVDLGTPEIIIGDVVGTDYCHFYDKEVDIKDIKVKLGQYVEEGEIIAEADCEGIKDKLSGLYSRLNAVKLQNEFENSTYDRNLELFELKKSRAEYRDNMGLGCLPFETPEELDEKTELYKEDHEYQNKLYEFNKRTINEAIAEYNEILTDGVLKAKKAGYVTFVKDMSITSVASGNENIVTITDMEDTYITTDIGIRDYHFRKYPVKFILSNGEKIPITEYDYTDAEVAFSDIQNSFPAQRFKTIKEVDYKPGDRVVMEFYKDDKNDCLAVGSDSYRSDTQGFFVYVKGENGELVKKYFEAGITDEHYIEVISGLEEGEEVLFVQDKSFPDMTEEYETAYETYKDIDTTKGCKYVTSSSRSYDSDCNAEVEEVYVKDHDEVKAGDPLVKLSVDAQKGNLVEIQNKINTENRNYEDESKSMQDDYDDMYKTVYDSKASKESLSVRLNELSDLTSKDPDNVSLAEEKSETEKNINELSYTIRITEIEMEILSLNKELKRKIHEDTIKSLNSELESAKKENDGTGYKTIYAENDGTIVNMIVDKGDKIKAGSRLVITSEYFDDVVRFGVNNVFENVGYTYNITVTREENKGDNTLVTNDVYEGKVIKSNKMKFPTVFTENGKVYSISGQQTNDGFYVKIEDEDFFKMDSQFSTLSTTYESMRIDGMMIVDGSFVFEEITFDDKEYYYVWVKNQDSGEVYKKYVLTGKKPGLGDTNKVVVLAGLSEGDILVK